MKIVLIQGIISYGDWLEFGPTPNYMQTSNTSVFSLTQYNPQYNNQYNEKCNIGGNKQTICKGICPPCWIKNEDSSWDCFDYDNNK